MNSSHTILIVGDWVIDEYWFLVRHQSTISSHTGREHFRVVFQPGQIMRDLCGAGHVARVLAQLRKRQGSSYKLIGLGSWDPKDTDLIGHLFHEDCELRQPRYRFRIDAGDCKEEPSIALKPLASSGATTKVVRLYTENGRTQLSRIDWERPLEHVNDQVSLQDLLNSIPKDNVTVVIYDHGKGVVTDGLVDLLATHFATASWYVRSKFLSPGWLTNLHKNVSIALLLIGPEVAAQLDPIGNWLTDGKLNRLAFEQVSKLRSIAKSCVLLSDARHVIATLPNGGVITGEPLRQVPDASTESSAIGEVGWSSSVFAQLIHETHADGQLNDERLENALTGIEDVRRSTLAGYTSPKNITNPVHRWKPKDGELVTVSTEEELWASAMRPETWGIIDKDRLDVWRASTDLPGYVAITEEKREIIRSIASRLRAFRQLAQPRPWPLSIILLADPGAGKTSLARALAKAFGFLFIGRDLTQLGDREEILDLFDSIATRQAEGEDVLVFIDEINAPFGLSHAYPVFLTPLEEGTYFRRGQTFTLRPCVWLFAGTGLSLDTRAPVGSEQTTYRRQEADDKAADFAARVTSIEHLDLASLKATATKKRGAERFLKEACLEQLYLGASMLHRYHPHVTHVTLEVLWRFFDLDPEKTPGRLIRKYASSLRDVQYGMVRRENLEELDECASSRRRDGGDQLIRLVFS